MKTIFQGLILSLTILILLTNCGGNAKQNRDETSEKNLVGSKINTADAELDSVTLSKLKKVYFLNLNIFHRDKLLKGYAEPSDSSQVVAGFQFGDTIPVLEDTKDGWLIVYANLGQRKYDSSKNTAYIKKENLGKIEDLKLEEKDFYTIRTENGELRQLANDTLKIEIISQKEFLSKLKTHTSPIEEAKHGIKQEDGVLSIITGNGIINLKDKNPIVDTTLYDDQVLTYSYEGFNKALNAHMIKHQEWESSGYNLYSQATADMIASTVGYPSFSKDNEFLIDISYNPYEENGAELNLQKKDGKGSYNTYLSFNFLNWSPLRTSDDNDINYFWAGDGSVYIKTIIREGNYTALESIGSIVQYIEISFLTMQN